MIFKFVFIKISLFVLINTILQLKICIKTILIYIILMYMKFNMKFNNLDKISKQIIYRIVKSIYVYITCFEISFKLLNYSHAHIPRDSEISISNDHMKFHDHRYRETRERYLDSSQRLKRIWVSVNLTHSVRLTSNQRDEILYMLCETNVNRLV